MTDRAEAGRQEWDPEQDERPDMRPVAAQTREVAVERALGVLELLAPEGRGLRVSDIAGALGVNKAIAFRALGALSAAGYAYQDAETQRYHASFKVAALGLRKIEAAGLEDWAQVTLDELARQTRELVRLAVIDGDRLRWVAKAQGSNSRLIVDPASGADVVLHATASGKAWLSTLDDETVAETLGPTLPPRTERTTTETHALLNELQVVRDRGFAVTLEEMDEGVNAIAAPITPSPGRPGVATISIAGPASRLPPDTLQDLAPHLIQAARTLSGQWRIETYRTEAKRRE